LDAASEGYWRRRQRLKFAGVAAIDGRIAGFRGPINDKLNDKLTDAMELSGCGTALVTPFLEDGAQDDAALVRLVNWQVESGIDFLIPCGTTGEASTLSEAEHLRVVETVVSTVAGRVPVYAGCTHNATREAVARAKRLAKIAGLTGLLTANPYYNRPGQEGQYQHFRAIAEAVDLPILLYNIPSRTGVNLDAATALRLAEVTNVIGIKESSGNLTQISELIANAPRGFAVFAGDDGLALDVIALGGAGLVSVASNVIPAQMAQMVRAAMTGDTVTAHEINDKYQKLMQAHFCEPSPAPVKAVLALMGRCEETLRLPMIPVTATTKAKLYGLLNELGLA
jgi:4-hydroxy-tetrahydrodipicolinate synthase